MKQIKASDLRAKSEDELNKQLMELRKGQFNQRFQKTNQQLTNTSQVRAVRRNIAQIKTILNEKQGAPAKAPKAPAKKATKAKAKA